MLAKTIRRPVQVTLKELETLKTVCSTESSKKKFYKTRCMVASKKNGPRCELRIRDANIKNVTMQEMFYQRTETVRPKSENRFE